MLRARRRCVAAAALGLVAVAGAATAADPLKVGAIYSLSGTYVVTEGPALKAARLAVQELNEAGGIKGRPIELIHYDGRSMQANVVDAARRLVHEDGVIAIIGVFDSAFYLASAPIAQDAGVPYIDSGGTMPNLPERVGEFAHMMPFGDDDQAQVAAEFAAQDLGAGTAFVLRNADWDYTRALARFFKEGFEEHGGEILGESSYHTGDTDYSAHIAKIRDLNPQPDVIYAAVNPGDDATFVRQAREAGVTLPIIGADAFDNRKLVKDAGVQHTEQVFFTTHMALTEDGGAVSRFIGAYEAEYGMPPENAFAGLGYDSVHLLAEAMRRASELTPEAVNDAIFSITDFSGVTGAADFSDPRRAPDKEVTLIAVRGGRFELIGKRRPPLQPSKAPPRT